MNFLLRIVWFQNTSLKAVLEVVVLSFRRYDLIPSLFYFWLWDTRLCLFLVKF